MTAARPGVFARAAKVLSKVEPNELKATVVSTLFVFILMASYYILRPVRDSLASNWTDSEVSFLWNINFFVSAAIVAAYGLAVSRAKLRHIVPAMYGFFAATFVVFYFTASFIDERTTLDKLFYLWVSVFALFNMSVFWTFMADTFNPGQSRRLFAIIATGASAGQLVGSGVAGSLAEVIGNVSLLLIASVGLVSVIPLVFYMYRLKETELGNRDLAADTSMAVMGGKWWEGFRSFASNPYLLGIGAFILLYVFINTFTYFVQKNLLTEFAEAERTQILATIDFLTGVLTYGLGLFVTGRIVAKLGMPIGLALMPVLICLAMLILAFAPILTVLIGLQIFRRGGNYGLTRPAREMLYTRVSQEDRFKAKPVIDIVVYRGGDAVSGTLFSTLTDGLGLGLAAVAVVGSAIAAAWSSVGVFLGRKFERLSGTADDRS